jgi:hypothetical protein
MSLNGGKNAGKNRDVLCASSNNLPTFLLLKFYDIIAIYQLLYKLATL